MLMLMLMLMLNDFLILNEVKDLARKLSVSNVF